MRGEMKGSNKRANQIAHPIKSYKSYVLSNQKTDEDADKTSSIANLKTIDQSQEILDQQIIWQEDYEKIMLIYERLQLPQTPLDLTTQKLANQLTEFNTAELLFKSSAPLWTSHRHTKLLESYFRIVSGLDHKSYDLTLLNNHEGSYLAVSKKGMKGSLQLFDIHDFPIQMLEKRKKFLTQLRNRYKCQLQNCKFSQLSEEIIYLYHNYKKLLQQVKNCLKQKIEVNCEMKQNIQELLKNLLRNLKQQKISKNKF